MIKPSLWYGFIVGLLALLCTKSQRKIGIPHSLGRNNGILRQKVKYELEKLAYQDGCRLMEEEKYIAAASLFREAIGLVPTKEAYAQLTVCYLALQEDTNAAVAARCSMTFVFQCDDPEITQVYEKIDRDLKLFLVHRNAKRHHP